MFFGDNNMLVKMNHPWQTGPTELISCAINHLHGKSEFDRRIAYLLFDVGIETLLKTYLTLPDETTNALIKYHERRQAAEGNFHDLVRGVKKAASDKLKNLDLSHIEYFHDIRNKIYHQGNGITIPMEHINAYAKIATELLDILLDVDLSDLWNKPDIQEKMRLDEEKMKKAIVEKDHDINTELNKLHNDFLLVLETVTPKIVLPSFKSKFTELTNKYLEKQIIDIDKENNTLYGFRFTRNPELQRQYYKELLDLLSQSIDDQKIVNALFKVEILDSGFAIQKIETVLNRIILSGYPDLDDIYFRILEILIPEFSQWYSSYTNLENIRITRSNPDFNIVESYNYIMNDLDTLKIGIENHRKQIRDWLIK
jgi:hypothetical protein